MALFEFKSHKAEVEKATNLAIAQMLEAWGMTAQGFASANCPVDTGNLSQSIDYSHDDDTMYVGTNVKYAPYVEFGTGIYAEKGGRQTPWKYKDSKGQWHTTVGMKPHHFLRDSVATHLDVYREIAQTYLKDNVEF